MHSEGGGHCYRWGLRQPPDFNRLCRVRRMRVSRLPQPHCKAPQRGCSLEPRWGALPPTWLQPGASSASPRHPLLSFDEINQPVCPLPVPRLPSALSNRDRNRPSPWKLQPQWGRGGAAEGARGAQPANQDFPVQSSWLRLQYSYLRFKKTV